MVRTRRQTGSAARTDAASSSPQRKASAAATAASARHEKRSGVRKGTAAAASSKSEQRSKEKQQQQQQATKTTTAAKTTAKTTTAKARPEPQPPALRTYEYPYGACSNGGADGCKAKLVSFNVTSLRALLRKSNALDNYLAREQPDVLALQETKLSEPVPHFAGHAPDYDKYFHCSRAKKGYSGTAVYLRRGSPLGAPRSVRYGFDEAIGVKDEEGRVIIVEFDALTLVNMYVPNAGAGLVRLDYRIEVWDEAVRRQMRLLLAQGSSSSDEGGGGGDGTSNGRPVVLAGDLNCAHEEIDIWNPAGNRRGAGFTDEERGSFTRTLRECHLVDSFRHCHPGVRAYSYWSQRHAQNYPLNRGWRLDYFVVNADTCVLDSFMRFDADDGVAGRMSDHVPIVLVMRLR